MGTSASSRRIGSVGRVVNRSFNFDLVFCSLSALQKFVVLRRSSLQSFWSHSSNASKIQMMGLCLRLTWSKTFSRRSYKRVSDPVRSSPAWVMLASAFKARRRSCLSIWCKTAHRAMATPFWVSLVSLKKKWQTIFCLSLSSRQWCTTAVRLRGFVNS